MMDICLIIRKIMKSVLFQNKIDLKLFVIIFLLSSISGDRVDLEDTCGTILRDRCPSLTKFVVGGVNWCAEKAPWNAVLEIRTGRRKKRQGSRITVLCGGTLVSSKHVVTAAHCVWGNRASSRTCSEPHLSMSPEQCRRSGCPQECLRVRAEDLNVYLGVTDIEAQNSGPRRVKHIHIHPGWDRISPLNNITNGHDLAVLEMDEAVTFTADTWPICLPNPNTDLHLIEPRRTVDVAGFGVHKITEDQGRVYPEILQSAELIITSKVECRSKSVWGITGDQICALGDRFGRTDTTDACSGDSGSGLTVSRHDGTNVLLGVVSFGESDCGATDGRPGVYTNMMSHVSWIKDVIDVGGSCTTIAGASCIFPFSFKGVIYTGCTSDHDPENKLWCSTMVDNFGKHVENKGQWGHCKQGCNQQVLPSPQESPKQCQIGRTCTPLGSCPSIAQEMKRAESIIGPERVLVLERLKEVVCGKENSPSVCCPSSRWSAWGEWSTCSATCGSGKKIRKRNCDGGGNCSGSNTQMETCIADICIESTWSDWESWTACSKSCGGGTRKRKRSCHSGNSKSASISVLPECNGQAVEKSVCKTRKCVKSGSGSSGGSGGNGGGGRRRQWSSWGEFGPCSSTCNGGTMRRYRTCEGSRGECLGAISDTQPCGRSNCQLDRSSGDDNMVTLLLGGWDGQWYLKNVTILTRNGKTCPHLDLPIQLADHFTVFKDNKVLNCGGRSSEQETLCWWWDPKNDPGEWTNAPRMSGGRSYANGLVTEGIVWVTGGWDGEVRHKTTEVLHNQASSWSKGPQLTIGKYKHCGVTLADGTVVITGGQEASRKDKGKAIKGNALDIVERYDWRTGLIERLPSLNQRRWTHACGLITIRGKEAVIVVGGRITSGSGDALSSVEVLVIGESSWQLKQDIPQPRLAPAMVVIANTPVISGGMYANGARDEVYPDTVLEYDVDGDNWKTVGRITGRNHHTAVAISRTLLNKQC